MEWGREEYFVSIERKVLAFGGHGGARVGLVLFLFWLPAPDSVLAAAAISCAVFSPPETQPHSMPGDVDPAAPNAGTLSSFPPICLPHAAPTVLQAEGNYGLWPQHPKQSIEG